MPGVAEWKPHAQGLSFQVLLGQQRFWWGGGKGGREEEGGRRRGIGFRVPFEAFLNRVGFPEVVAAILLWSFMRPPPPPLPLRPLEPAQKPNPNETYFRNQILNSISGLRFRVQGLRCLELLGGSGH